MPGKHASDIIPLVDLYAMSCAFYKPASADIYFYVIYVTSGHLI